MTTRSLDWWSRLEPDADVARVEEEWAELNGVDPRTALVLRAEYCTLASRAERVVWVAQRVGLAGGWSREAYRQRLAGGQRWMAARFEPGAVSEVRGLARTRGRGAATVVVTRA